MPTLVSIRIAIPGNWADAWLYKGHVLLWDRSGFMHCAALREIRSHAETLVGEDIAFLTDLLIFRNEWKLNKPFPRLMGLAGVAETLFDRMGQPQLVLPLENVEVEPVSGQPSFHGFLIDSAIYADRIYAATDSGIYETEVDLEHRDRAKPVEQVVDVWTRSVGANGSRIVAALGEKGLVSRRIDTRPAWWSAENKPSVQRIDDYSLSSSFARFSVLNYRGSAAPSFLRARTEAGPSTAPGQTTKVVTSYDKGIGLAPNLLKALALDPARRGSLVFPGILPTNALAEDDLRVVGDSNNRLLVAGPLGHAVVRLAEPTTRLPLRLTPTEGFQSHGADAFLAGAPNATHAVASGFVIEGFDRTGLITAEGAYDLLDEPVARVRSFPQSKRHTDCVTAIFEDRAELVGFIELPV